MSSINIPNFINVSVIVFALWPYNQSGTPARTARPPAARRTDTFSKSDNNTLRQILAEGKNLKPEIDILAKKKFEGRKGSGLFFVSEKWKDRIIFGQSRFILKGPMNRDVYHYQKSIRYVSSIHCFESFDTRYVSSINCFDTRYVSSMLIC